MKMRFLFLLFLLVVGVFGTPRVKRQAEAESGGSSANRRTSADFNSHSGTNSGDNIGDGSGNNGVGISDECDGPGTSCVPYYLCNEGEIITDGTGLINIRIGEDIITPHSKCERYLDVCCIEPDINVTPLPPTGIPHEAGCGRRNTEGVHAEITGFNVTQTQFGEYPWMVAVLRNENIGAEVVNLYLCGGSLIEPNVVLTAAHCVSGLGVGKHLTVRAGEWDTQREYELYPHQDRLVQHVIIHPEFDGGSLWNDFAVLILESPFILAPNIDTVCLPDADQSVDYVTCFATGWGKDKFGKEGRFQNILKQVALQVVPHNTCENVLRTTRLGEHFLLHQSFLCAGGEQGIDTCKGDGGSPLVCARPTSAHLQPTYYQAGIVAWGIGCGENGIPGVYANVIQGIDWIYSAFEPYLVA